MLRRFIPHGFWLKATCQLLGQIKDLFERLPEQKLKVGPG
jgi:hypothetical protein